MSGLWIHDGYTALQARTEGPRVTFNVERDGVPVIRLSFGADDAIKLAILLADHVHILTRRSEPAR